MDARTPNTKEVVYSYPSSPNADLFGFARTGCYTIRQGDKALAGYATKVEAIEAATKLPGEWSRYSIHA